MFDHPENAAEALMSAMAEEVIEPWMCVDVGWDRSRREDLDWVNIWGSWETLLEVIEECLGVHGEERIPYWGIMARSIRAWPTDPLVGFPLSLLKGKLPLFGPVLDRFLAAADGHNLTSMCDCIETIHYVFEQFMPDTGALAISFTASCMQYLSDYAREGRYRFVLMIPGQRNKDVLVNILEALSRQYQQAKQESLQELATLRVMLEHIRVRVLHAFFRLLRPGPSPPFVLFLAMCLPKLLTSCGTEDPL
jgi:hypothetical protein